MKKIIIIMIGLLLISLNVFADDVTIDSSGNVKTGQSSGMGGGNLDVTGASGEHAVRGVGSGTGAAGVYGENNDSSGYGGYFKGNAKVTGDLTVDGSFSSSLLGIGDTAPLADLGLGWGFIDLDRFHVWRFGDNAWGFGVDIGQFKQYVAPDANIVWGTRTYDGSATWSEKMRLVGSSGNLGIGTETPDFKLDIKGISNLPAIIRTNQIGTDNWTGLRMDRDSVETWFIGMNNGNDNLIFRRTGSSNDMTIDTSGNVGIGTINPMEGLDVNNGDIAVRGPYGFNANAEEARLILGDGNHTIKSIYQGGMRMGVYGAPNAISISEPSGNIGIGTSNPSQKLHIIGSGPRVLLETTDGYNPEINLKSPGKTGWAIYQSASTGDLRFYQNGDQVIFKNGTGNVSVKVIEITGGSDLSEQFDISSNKTALPPIPGMVVSIDPARSGSLKVCDKAYDKKVAGIISGAGGVNPGMLMGQKGTEADGSNPVALTGRVYAWADASTGAIEPGDLLTTSDTEGHAMKVTDYEKAQGAIIGKAMSSLDKGKGLVLMLVALQ